MYCTCDNFRKKEKEIKMERQYVFDLNEFGFDNDVYDDICASLEAGNNSYHTFNLEDGFFFTDNGDEIHTKIIEHLKQMQVYDEIMTERFPSILVNISW